jgi:hypothetical protein
LIAEYEREVYPGGYVPAWASPSLDDVRARRDWVLLLILGLGHTLGRTRSAQNRAFVDLCVTRGWLDRVFSRRVQGNETAWIEVLEDFLKDRIQDIPYFAWMRLVPSLYQCARWLDAYVRAFWSARQLSTPFSLDQITDVRSSPVFQGTDVDAPPLSRTLGIGLAPVWWRVYRLGDHTSASSRFSYAKGDR